MKSIFLIPIFFFIITNTTAQIYDDFSDNNFIDPEWIGDIDTFIINENKELQINDIDAGETAIFTKIMLDAIEIEWFINVKLNFDPSSSNYGKIFLALDQPSSKSDGYYIKMGASGSTDALELHQIKNGKDTKIATGTAGSIAKKPDIAIKATYVDNVLSIFADLDKSGLYAPEIIVNVKELNPIYFGLGGKYTKSNSKNFFYDNVIVQEYTPDTEGPVLKQTEVNSSNQITLVFDEPLNVENIQKNHFSLVNNNISNLSIGDKPNRITLTFDNDFSAKGNSTIKILQIQDQKGNISTDLEAQFSYYKFPQIGDIVINEILTDPIGKGADFIELHNKSAFNITLKNYVLVNKKNDKSVTMDNVVILANKQIALTSDPQNIIDIYTPLNEAHIIEHKLPALNNGDANITLLSPAGEELDSFDYNDRMHLAFIDNTEGVSLERINPELPTQESSNWHSAARSVNYGTPGYKNSALIQLSDNKETFVLNTPSFSPNQDAQNPIMAIQYNLDKPGYLSTVKIYDSNGYHIKNLHNNELLSTTGLINWDGQDKTGRLANIGIYIIVGEAYHSDGDIKRFKMAVSLLDFID